MNAGELCNRSVVIAARDLPVQKAAELTRTHHVGCVVVVEEGALGARPLGILTGDIVLAVVAKEVAARSLRVSEVMSADLLVVREGDSILDALPRMRNRGIRRVPVVDAAGSLVGILAADDMLEAVAEQLDEIVHAIGRERLHEGRAPLRRKTSAARAGGGPRRPRRRITP